MIRISYLISSLIPLAVIVLLAASVYSVGSAGHKTMSGDLIVFVFSYSMINIFLNYYCIKNDSNYRNRTIRILRVIVSTLVSVFLIYELLVLFIEEPLIGLEYLIPFFLSSYIYNEIAIIYDNK